MRAWAGLRRGKLPLLYAVLCAQAPLLCWRGSQGRRVAGLGLVLLLFLTGARTGRDSAQADLDEAWEIAERGPMRLFLADIHLHRARLFGLPIAD